MKNQFYHILFLTLSFASCKKLVDAGAPKTLSVSSATFSDKNSATAALLGIYNSLTGFQTVNYSTLPGLSSDELVSWSSPVSRYYTNSLNSTVNDDFWGPYYNYIYQANNLIAHVQVSTGIAEADKTALIADATFLRAFFHFYLVNFFGDIPYIITPDYAINSQVVRESVMDSVYPHIVSDLLFAQAHLPEAYPGDERVRANKAVATAMLARVYLYMGKWAEAEAAATAIIDNPDYILEDLGNVFLSTSQEAIWQLSANHSFYNNAYEAFLYVLRAVPSRTGARVSLSDYLYNAFEDGDTRKTAWTGTYTPDNSIYYHYCNKYSNKEQTGSIEYSTVMRLAEQYLIRGEARAQQGKVERAMEDVDAIRARAGLDPLTAGMSQADVLQAILHERQVELFVEWGHRWLDLKRTNTIDAVMPAVCAAKGGDWKSEWQLYPIPVRQLSADPKMTQQQNPGY